MAPAGDLEKLKFAYHYGADAAYIGGGNFSLRAGAGFNIEELAAASQMAKQLQKKLYVAVNAFAHNEDFVKLPDFLRQMKELHPDALIVSDPGVFSLCREIVPEIPLHISTQANNTNYATARFWAANGAKRIVLARELSLAEAAEITARGSLETEIFVHGAMCISYSGRCLISKFLTGRDANQGDCTHPCRWNYVLEEEKRPGEYFPILEDARGSYIMNSKDLCLLPLLPQLVESGITSWKIEGRHKSAYYVANTVRVYRAALDAYYEGKWSELLAKTWCKELGKVSHRDYTTGFALRKPEADAFRYDDGGYLRNYDFVAIAYGVENGMLLLEQKNHFSCGDELELLLPKAVNLKIPVAKILDEQGREVAAANHPHQRIRIPFSADSSLPWPLICRKKTSAK